MFTGLFCNIPDKASLQTEMKLMKMLQIKNLNFLLEIWLLVKLLRWCIMMKFVIKELPILLLRHKKQTCQGRQARRPLEKEEEY